MRRGRSTDPGRFESAVTLMATIMDWDIEWHRPEGTGREASFFRDIEMVKDADVVICVFDEASPMEGGTGHVVEKAQDRATPVYAYLYEEDGHRYRRLGEWDPTDSWARRVPDG